MTTIRAGLVPFGLVLVCLVGVDQALAAEQTVSPGLIRLVDLCDEAAIRSPLLEIEAARSPADLPGELDRDTILDEDFEQFDPDALHWSNNGPSGAGPRPGGKGQAYCYRGGGAHQVHFVLPAEPGGLYRFARSIRTRDPRVDLVVAETDTGLDDPGVLNHPQDVSVLLRFRFVRGTSLLMVHRFPPPRAEGAWERGEVTFRATPQTRSLVLILQDTEATTEQEGLRTWIDDLQVELLRPSRRQELALLAAADAAAFDSSGSGFVKHGQLLPIGDAETVEPPCDHNFDFRTALFAPAPTRMAFEVRVPRRASLKFSVALSKASRPGDRATFRVRVRTGDGKVRTHFRRTLSVGRDRRGWRWYDQVLPLGEYAGRKVRLILDTRAPRGRRGLCLWGNPVIDRPRRGAEPPSVILIGVDTLRADRMSAWGHERATTPRIEALARDGVLFEQTVSPTNWTVPSFASMFTGLMPATHRVTHRSRVIAPEVITVAERLRAAGWQTHGIAYKAYLYNMGFEQGFDTWFNVPRAHIRGSDNLHKALAWLERNHDRRFFLFLHLNDPHQPFNQPAPYVEKYAAPGALAKLGAEMPLLFRPDGGVNGCAHCRREGDVRPEARRLARDLYDGSVAYTDALVGELVDALKKHGIYQDTLLVFVSDHGEVMWEHENYFGHGGPRLWDELVMVPLLIKPPASADLARGRRVAAQVSALDLVPTLLGMLGVEGADQTEGRSLLPLMQKEAAPAGSRTVITETGGVLRHIVAARDGRFKYILYKPREREPLEHHLYDLDNDPAEQRNLADSRAHRAVRERLQARVLDFMMRHRRGRYLVVTGDGTERNYRLRLRNKDGDPCRARVLLGPRDLPGRLRQTTSSRLVFVARLDPDAGASCTATLRATAAGGDEPVRLSTRVRGEKAARYRRGMLAEWIRQPAPAIHLATSRPRRAGVEANTSLNADQIEVLRSMGYVE